MSKDESEWNRIFDYIKQHSNGDRLGAPHWKVMKSSKIAAFQFDRHIQTLLLSKKIEKFEAMEGKNKCVYYKILD